MSQTSRAKDATKSPRGEASAAAYFPSRPPFRSLTQAEKIAAFGDPTRGVKLADEDRTFVPNRQWAKDNIHRVSVPRWFSRQGAVAIHRKVAPQLLSLLTGWELAGVHEAVLSMHGTVAFRRTRGGASLSSHAFGIAFDINAPQNAFRAPPAGHSDEGCVYELVKIANEHGWFWGGHFSTPDGMHFEVAVVQP